MSQGGEPVRVHDRNLPLPLRRDVRRCRPRTHHVLRSTVDDHRREVTGEEARDIGDIQHLLRGQIHHLPHVRSLHLHRYV